MKQDKSWHYKNITLPVSVLYLLFSCTFLSFLYLIPHHLPILALNSILLSCQLFSYNTTTYLNCLSTISWTVDKHFNKFYKVSSFVASFMEDTESTSVWEHLPNEKKLVIRLHLTSATFIVPTYSLQIVPMLSDLNFIVK